MSAFDKDKEEYKERIYKEYKSAVSKAYRTLGAIIFFASLGFGFWWFTKDSLSIPNIDLSFIGGGIMSILNLVWLIIPIAIIALSIKIIRPTERGLVERLGKYNRFAEPGINFLIPLVDRLIRVNITEQMVDAQPQEVITKDNLNARVDAQVYFKIKSNEENVVKSQYNVDDYFVQIVALSRTTLRDIIGKLSFKEVNSMREKLNNALAKELDSQTDAWGIEVVRTELKEIEPPRDVQDTMNEIIKAENEKIAAKDFATATETQADGTKRAEIKQAEGIARAITLKAEAEAKAIKVVNEASDKYFKGNAVDYKRLLAAEEIFKNNSKIVVPNNSSIMDLISHLVAAEGVLKKESK